MKIKLPCRELMCVEWPIKCMCLIHPHALAHSISGISSWGWYYPHCTKRFNSPRVHRTKSWQSWGSHPDLNWPHRPFFIYYFVLIPVFIINWDTAVVTMVPRTLFKAGQFQGSFSIVYDPWMSDSEYYWWNAISPSICLPLSVSLWPLPTHICQCSHQWNDEDVNSRS